MQSSEVFYIDLPLHKVKLEELYADDTLFAPVPDDWCVLVADIKDSTSAVVDNLHNEVNLAATGCIVAVLNTLKKDDKSKVPYFFGGDGATFLIPNSYRERLHHVLRSQKEHVKRQWNLELVVGFLDVHQIYKKGYTLKVAKVQMNAFLKIPIVLGMGLKYAEGLIKNTSVSIQTDTLTESPDLEGMECRWEKIPPPTLNKNVLCLLVHCTDENIQRTVYLEVLSALTQIFGDLEERQPISIPKLKLDATYEKIKREMFASIGRHSYRYILKKLFDTYLGKIYFKYSKDGRKYLRMTRELSETVMIDGTLNMIIAGTMTQINTISEVLNQMELDGRLIYGKHTTHSSIMSCYVQDRKTEHAHFIDGAEGGYTQAAEMLKSKLAHK